MRLRKSGLPKDNMILLLPFRQSLRLAPALGAGYSELLGNGVVLPLALELLLLVLFQWLDWCERLSD